MSRVDLRLIWSVRCNNCCHVYLEGVSEIAARTTVGHLRRRVGKCQKCNFNGLFCAVKERPTPCPSPSPDQVEQS